MRVLNLWLQDVYAHKDTRLDFSKKKSAVIIGPNRAGKSSLIDAIFLALYGRKAARGSLRSIIRTNCREATVSLWFEVGKESYRVVRTIGTSKHIVTLHKKSGDEWISMADGNVGVVDDAIRDVVGFEYESLLAISYWSQSDADHDLLTAKPTERRLLLSRLIGVGRFRDYEREANKHAEGKVKEIELLQLNLGQWEDQLNSDREILKSSKAESKKLVKERKDLTKKLQDIVKEDKELSSQLARLDGDKQRAQTAAHLRRSIELTQTRREKCQQEIEKLQALLDSVPSGESDDWKENASRAQSALESFRALDDRHLRELSSSIDAAVRQRTIVDLQYALRTLQKSMKEELEGVSSRIEEAKRADELLKKRPRECDMDHCGFICASVEAKSALLKSDEGKAKQLVERLEIAQTQLDLWSSLRDSVVSSPLKMSLQNVVTSIQGTAGFTSQDEAEAAVAHYEQVSQTMVRRVEMEQRLKNLESELANCDLRLSETKSQLEEYADLGELDERPRYSLNQKIGLLEANRKAIDADLIDIEKELPKCQMTIGRLEERISATEREQTDGAEELQVLVSQDRKARAYRYAHAFFRAVPGMMLQQFILELEHSANKMLEAVVPHLRFKIEVTIDKIEIFVVAPGAIREIETYCGSETFSLQLAWRLALRDTLVGRSDHGIGTWIFDEAGFGSLDDGNVELVRELLEDKAEGFGLMMLVSHIPAIQECCGTQVQCSPVGENHVHAEILH